MILTCRKSSTRSGKDFARPMSGDANIGSSARRARISRKSTNEAVRYL